MRQATDEQVALYLEEHEPSLQAAIISAVEAERGGSGSPFSATLVRRLVESAVEKAREHRGRSSSRSRAGTAIRHHARARSRIAAIALFLARPGVSATCALRAADRLAQRRSSRAVQHRGHTGQCHRRTRRRSERSPPSLSGFDSEQASLMVRKSADAAVRARTASAQREWHVSKACCSISPAPIEYFVEANGVNSKHYNLKVVDLPYVQRLELEYHFPAYTGLAPQKVEDGGDIAVLKGTEVQVRAVPTMSAPGGQIVLGDKDRSSLAPDAAGGSPVPLVGAFKVETDGFYHIELDAPSGERLDRVSAIHHRRARRSAADGLDLEAGARHARRRRSKRCSSRRAPRTTSASAIWTSSTR